MDVWTNPAKQDGPYCLIIGNFDGLHLGHQTIIAQARTLAKSVGCRVAVLSFQPHPLKILAPEKAPRLLQTPDQKQRLLAYYQVDAYLPLAFDRHMSRLPPRDFVEYLRENIDFKHLFVGFNFRFGFQRRGDIELLHEMASSFNFQLHAISAVNDKDGAISSSRIRRLVMAGDLVAVGDLLGRPYFLEGEVVKGRQLGRALAVPTANLLITSELVPANGVYATWARLQNGVWWRAITNIGQAPTVGDGRLGVETHLFDFCDDLYDQHLQLYFGAYLRPETRFKNLAVLKDQIHRDFEQRLAFSDHQPPTFCLLP